MPRRPATRSSPPTRASSRSSRGRTPRRRPSRRRRTSPSRSRRCRSGPPSAPASWSTASSSPPRRRSGATRTRRACRSSSSTSSSRSTPRCPWVRSASPTCRASTRSSRWRATCATPTATASTSTAAWSSWSSAATSAPRPGRGSMSTADATRLDERIAERFTLKALVEACLVLEEGIAGVREIDLGLMMGTGMVPGPFARADFRGLDDVLAALERAEEEWGEHFAPPLMLRRLVAQGRLGAKSGQGFYPYPQPDEGYETAVVKLDRRGDDVAVLWLDNPPANSLSPQVIEALETAWKEVDGSATAVIVASPNPALFCAGADIKAFTKMDPAGGKGMLDRAHELLRSFERSRTMTIAAVNGMALGGGCELAMACDVRIAAYSAAFGQPEISLGIIPGFGGTQRLPRLVGPAKALGMNTTGEPISAGEAFEYGLVNTVVPDHELFDAALNWAHKFARQAPVALEQIKRVSHAGDLDEGIEAEK